MASMIVKSSRLAVQLTLEWAKYPAIFSHIYEIGKA
jgi:hypothetical protein